MEALEVRSYATLSDLQVAARMIATLVSQQTEQRHQVEALEVRAYATLSDLQVAARSDVAVTLQTAGVSALRPNTTTNLTSTTYKSGDPISKCDGELPSYNDPTSAICLLQALGDDVPSEGTRPCHRPLPQQWEQGYRRQMVLGQAVRIARTLEREAVSGE